MLVQGEYIALGEEADIYTRDTTKLQKIIARIEFCFQKAPEARFFPCFSYVSNNSFNLSLTQRLVEISLDWELRSSIRERAVYALQLLEKVDPLICAINYEMDKFRDKNCSHDLREAAFWRLQNFVERRSHGPLKIHFPVRPYKPLKMCSLPFVPAPKYMGVIHKLFWEIKKIFVAPLDKEYFLNLKNIAGYEGFKIEVIAYKHEVAWIRDRMLLMPTGEVLLPARFYYDEVVRKVVWRLVNHLKAPIMGTVALMHHTERFLQEPFFGQKEAPFYFEAGNLLFALNQFNERVHLSGSYNLLYTLLNGAFTFESLEKSLLERMESLEDSQLFSEERIKFVKQRLASAWLFSAFLGDKAQTWLTKLCIAAIECIKEIMTLTLKTPVIFLGDVFERQPEFHLDMFLTLAPGGKIFIQSHEKCVKLLKDLLKTTDLPLSHQERLYEYLSYAEADAEELDPQLKKIGIQLTQAGFKVIPMAGIFYTWGKTREVYRKSVTLNFLNGITGIGKKGTFCITNGSSHPVDKHLRSAAFHFLKEQGIDTVYFVGRDSVGTISSLGGLEYLFADQNISDSGGVHCLTQHTNALHHQLAVKSSSLSMRRAATPTETPSITLVGFFQKMLKLANISIHP